MNAPTVKTPIKKLLANGIAAPFPSGIKPMLATLVNDVPTEGDWLYEIKWDGYRALTYLYEGKVEMRSRNDKSFNEKFYPLFQTLQAWKINAVFDGEIVVLNDKGVPDFGSLQGWRSEADGRLSYYIFDLLWLEGTDLTSLPLETRREVLRSLPMPGNTITISENFSSTGKDFFALAKELNLEGIIAKRAGSIYRPGDRTRDWIKIKVQKHQEAVIAGYTLNENTSKQFSALLLGLYDDSKFIFIGPVGTGFSNTLQTQILQKLKPLVTNVCPFKAVPDFNKPSRFRPNPPKAAVTWVKPEVVCEINYLEITRDGAIRHPSFRGLREDKKAKDIVRETPVTAATAGEKPSALITGKIISTPSKNERRTLLNPKEEMQTRNVEGHDLTFTNLSKIYWPKEKVTKRDMLNYYYLAAPYILPYVKDKPQTLNRYPNGIDGKAFYQKNVKGKVPSWVETFAYHSEKDNEDKEFLVCSNEASILYIASLGCIEINPWSSTTKTPDNPDWCIIDLDPDKNTFNQVIEAAKVTKQVLDDIGVNSFCKTSGSTGFHIYIPLGAKYVYEDSKELGRAIAKMVQQQLPKYTSIERKIADREGKMYIDFLQNRPQATVAGPYSMRPKPGAPVSMPLHWDEVKKGLKMLDFTIFNATDRLKQQGDIFKGVLGKGIDVTKAMKKLAAMVKE